MHHDFDAAVHSPFRMQPGLRRLDGGAAQLTPCDRDSRHLREKLAVLATVPDRALVQRAGFDAGPALDALARQAAAEHPADFLIAGERWLARRLGWAVAGAAVIDDGGPADIGACLRSLVPEWRRAGLLCLAFAEDFAIIDGRDTTIPWLAVALPSHWAPQDKVGLPFAAVHSPVADNRLIVDAAAALSRLVCGAQRWERFVWTIAAQPQLNAHPLVADRQGWTADLSPDQLAARAWWRCERQTFIPVPAAEQAVFTIAVEVEPLGDMLADPARAARVHAALASMSPAVLDYRGLGAVRDRLLTWLAERAGGRAGSALDSKP